MKGESIWLLMMDMVWRERFGSMRDSLLLMRFMMKEWLSWLSGLDFMVGLQGCL
jgi:hypothetical protein